MITDLNIRQSLFKYLQTSSLADDFHTGNPEKFDPNRTDTQEWVYISVPRIKRSKQHLNREHYDVTIRCEVKARGQDQALGAASMAAKVQTALEHVVIPVYDFTETPDLKIGLLRIHEAESSEDVPKEWQQIRLTFTCECESLD